MSYRLLIGALLALTLTLAAQKNDSADVMLGSALHQEEVEDNCMEAIKSYEKVIQQKGVSRNTAARAQLHIGSCREKLGLRDARAAYELVLSRYADQPEVTAAARARIGVLSALDPSRSAQSGGGMTSRQVWARDPALTLLTVSEDGRYVVYSDHSQSSDLFLHDLLTSEDRRLTRTPDGSHPDGAAFSRDGKRLVYSWHSDQDKSSELRVIDLQDPGIPRPVVLSQAGAFRDLGLGWLAPLDWSPDGTRIAVYVQRGEGDNQSRELVLLNSKGGSQTVIKSYPSAVARFSPDGKFLAFAVHERNPTQNDIAVVSVDGGSPIPAVADPAQDRLLGWSPDGKYLVFTSDRRGKTSLYAQSLANGRPEAAPVLLKNDFPFEPVTSTVSGQLLYEIRDLRRIYGDIKFADYDFAAERFINPPALGVKDYVGHNAAADWSPDGKYLLNISDREGQVLVIHSAETGAFVRELRNGLTLNQGVPWPKWSADSRFIAVPATDVNSRRQGIFRVDAQTGEASPLALSQPGETLRGPAFSPDGKKFLYTRVLPNSGTGPEQRVIMEKDLATGTEREIMRGDLLTVVLFSPDGRYFTTVRTDDQVSVLLLVSANGGEPKELMRVNSPDRLWVEFWAPDSRSVYVGKFPEPIETWWRVSIDTGERRTVQLDQNMGLSVRVHPDGRRLAYAVQSERSQSELWVLENFLSSVKPSK